MRPADITCRTCRKAYNIPEGCAICEPAKRNIMWPDPAQEGSELLSTGRQALRLLQLNLDRLEREMTQGSVGARTQAYRPEWATAAQQLARSLAALVTEMRKLEEREQKRVQAATFDEQVEIMVSWVENLPREHQHTVMDALVRLLEPAQPAQLSSGIDGD